MFDGMKYVSGFYVKIMRQGSESYLRLINPICLSPLFLKVSQLKKKMINELINLLIN